MNAAESGVEDMPDTVRPDSLVTLHYRIALADDTELLSTFSTTPATLKLGAGELAGSLERCLVGLPVGERHVFLLEAEQAFGVYHAALVQRMPRTSFPQGSELEIMHMVEFAAPDGTTHAGLVRELSEEYVLIDFNHPLAGKAIRFEVEVIGIL
jgi:FKBP-type peptidyl-prolyl cis-trans isomerase SlpA